MKLIRSTHHKFTCRWEDASGNPVIPKNADRYPAVAIKDPTGQIVTDGVANRSTDRDYIFEWYVPLDATLSTAEQSNSWKIEWYMISLSGQQLKQVSEFDVIDRLIVPTEERNFTHLSLKGDSERLVVRFDREQYEISCKIVRNVGDAIPIFYSTVLGSEDDPTMIHMIVDEGQVSYWIDTPVLVKNGQYIAIWKSREKRLSQAISQLQYIRVPEPDFWRQLPSLRILIDKLHKKVGLPQAYTDSDCYDYMMKGVGIINRYQPPTSWSIGNYPYYTYGLDFFLIEASAMYALCAQYLSEVELGFDFSGQTLQLAYDHTAGYSDMLGRLENDLNEFVPPVKKYIRKKGPGSLGVRPMPGELGRESRVIPFSDHSNILDNLVRLGLV